MTKWAEIFFFETLKEKVSPTSPYCDVMPEMKSGDEQKDPQRGTQNQKLLKMRKEDLDIFAEELGGEVLDAEIIDENVVGKVLQTALKTATKVKPAKLKLGKDAPGAIVKYKPPGKLTAPKVKGKVTTTSKTKTDAIVKYEPQTTSITKVETQPKDLVKTQVGTLVNVDPKTGAIVSTATKTKSKVPTPPTPPSTPTPLPKPKKGLGLNLPIPGLPGGPKQSIDTAWAKQISSKR
ncbi:hypothetical protein [Synechococcus phage DSL-LC02]|nr:hypothetical protein [Synechococcus phage DSL-LC02]